MSWYYDHVHFRCSDYERTVVFFRENFGAKEINRAEVHGWPHVTLDIGGSWFNFSPKRPGEIMDPSVDQPRYGVYHIALKTRDLEKAAVELKARGIRFTQEVRQVTPTTKSGFVEGPDGISIEILQRD